MLPKPRTVYQQTEIDCLLAGPAPGKWTRRGSGPLPHFHRTIIHLD